MASTQQGLQFIVIDDFSPGIWATRGRFDAGLGRIVYTSSEAPNGAAQLVGTKGCVCGPDGKSLIAGPGLTRQVIETPFDLPLDQAHYPAYAQLGISITGPAVNITAMRVLSPTFMTPAGFNTGTEQESIFILYQWWLNAGGGGTMPTAVQKSKFRLYKTYNSTTYDIQSMTGAAAGANGIAGYSRCSIDFSRANNAAPTLPGNPIAYGVWSDLTQANVWQRAYPAQATPGTDSSDSLAAAMNNAYYAFSHQDRIIFTRVSGNELLFGTGSQTVEPEALFATNVNNYSASSAGVVFVAESPTGIGSWVSMNASTLMMFKRNGGGYMMSGPYEQPTITRFPGVQSADIANLGCLTPNGTYVYGNSRGVWEWSGGDNCSLISQQIDGAFWNQSVYLTNYQGMQGSFAYSYPYISVPGGFLYDTTTGSWWQIGNPASMLPTYVYAQTTANGRFVLTPAAFDNVNFTSVADYYDITVGQPVWIWQSQPIAETVNRELDYREINITAYAQAGGTIQVNLSTPIQTGPYVTINMDSSTLPYTYSIPYECRGSDVSIGLISSSGSTSVAPAVIRVSVGYQEREMARHA